MHVLLVHSIVLSAQSSKPRLDTEFVGCRVLTGFTGILLLVVVIAHLVLSACRFHMNLGPDLPGTVGQHPLRLDGPRSSKGAMFSLEVILILVVA